MGKLELLTNEQCQPFARFGKDQCAEDRGQYAVSEPRISSFDGAPRAVTCCGIIRIRCQQIDTITVHSSVFSHRCNQDISVRPIINMLKWVA